MTPLSLADYMNELDVLKGGTGRMGRFGPGRCFRVSCRGQEKVNDCNDSKVLILTYANLSHRALHF
ncbi:MAG: hypothetical protein VYA34_06075 [Myxococcota bacterium]|nr:hypothetical protein [Myxococcota bacterium]